MKKILAALILLLTTGNAYASFEPERVMRSMTLEEKIGQLFIIRPDQLDKNLPLEIIHSDKLKDNDKGTKIFRDDMLETLSKYPAGGFVLFRKNIDDPEQLKALTSKLKEASNIIPIIAVDEEGGRIARIANNKNFHVKKFLSAAKITDAKEAGATIGEYLREYGFNMNFAPVADINTNPKNIVIGDRAFGTSAAYVSRMAGEYLDGLHSQGILGSLKHFPGHGDTTNDTHAGRVIVNKTWEELTKAELIPFIENFGKTDSIMSAHITLTKLDTLPATLSQKIINEKLRDELDYDGVIITDALMMGAVNKHYSSSEAAVLALEAGCDILLMPYDYAAAFEGIIEAVNSGRLDERRINESVLRVMNLKEKIQDYAETFETLKSALTNDDESVLRVLNVKEKIKEIFTLSKPAEASTLKEEDNEMLKWWQKSIVYQVYPKSFCDTKNSGTGDIKGITSKLDYLQDLGIGAIWLTPVYPSPMIDNGYDISDYTGIGENFGTMKDFDELIAEANKRDIKIVMDLVFNHCSDQHKWFQESKSSRDNAKADWFIWRDAKPDGSVPTNWRSIFGGSAWTWCEERQQYYLHTFANEQPDLNWENPEVRRALYDAANFWLKKGVGGFRIDAITYIKKPEKFIDGEPDGQDGTINIHTMTANTPGILDFLHEFKREVSDGHDIFTVGEANGVSADELPQWVGKDGVFDMLFEFSHVTLPFDKAEIWCKPVKWKLTDLKRALTASQNATRLNGWYPIFFENHDQPRSVNHFFPEGYDAKKSAKALAAILLTMRGTPFIYQGEELGMTNKFWRNIDEVNDIQTHGQYNLSLSEGFSPEEAMKFIRYFTRDNARTPMQWNDEINAGFTSGKSWLPVNENYHDINAEAETKDANSVLSWYKTLINFRRSHEILTAGSYKEIFADSEEIFAYERELDGEKVIVVVNFTDKSVRLPNEYFADKKIILSSENNFDSLELVPLEARLYE